MIGMRRLYFSLPRHIPETPPPPRGERLVPTRLPATEEPSLFVTAAKPRNRWAIKASRGVLCLNHLLKHSIRKSFAHWREWGTILPMKGHTGNIRSRWALGWYMVSTITWCMPHCRPESVQDTPAAYNTTHVNHIMLIIEFICDNGRIYQIRVPQPPVVMPMSSCYLQWILVRTVSPHLAHDLISRLDRLSNPLQ